MITDITQPTQGRTRAGYLAKMRWDTFSNMYLGNITNNGVTLHYMWQANGTCIKQDPDLDIIMFKDPLPQHEGYFKIMDVNGSAGYSSTYGETLPANALNWEFVITGDDKRVATNYNIIAGDRLPSPDKWEVAKNTVTDKYDLNKSKKFKVLIACAIILLTCLSIFIITKL